MSGSPRPPFVPTDRRRARVGALAVLGATFVAVVVRGRPAPATPQEAVREAVTGAFYHWRHDQGGSAFVLDAEGWCALRRSRALTYRPEPGEERRSPRGVYRKAGRRATFEPRSDVTGMEVGDDFLSHAVRRLAGENASWRPLGGGRFRLGEAVFTLEPGGRRIVGIDTPTERIRIDYPLALSNDLFEAPRA